MGGRILAINEGFGYRPVLSVQNILPISQFNARPPSVVLSGSQLVYPAAPFGGVAMPANEVTFQNFFAPYIGIATVWDQLKTKPNQTLDQIYQAWPQIPFGSIAEATLTLVAAGSDPLRGFWLQFRGMGIAPLFSQAAWWDESVDDVFLPDPYAATEGLLGQNSCY